jgi:hypothetical protein
VPRLLLLLVLLAAATPALAQLVLICGLASPIGTLTREQAERLFLGRLGALPEGLVVHPLDLPAGPLRDQFYLRLTGKNPNQIRAHWSRLVFTGRAAPPREAASAAEVRALVARHPDLVGYLPASELDAGVRVLLRVE